MHMTKQVDARTKYDPDWLKTTASRFLAGVKHQLEDANRRFNEAKKKEAGGRDQCKVKEDAAQLATLLEGLTNLLLPFHQDLAQQIAAWRREVVSGDVMYEERDDLSFRHALQTEIAMCEQEPWVALVAFSQNGGCPPKGLDELNEHIEEARKMLREWAPPVSRVPCPTTAETVGAQDAATAEESPEDWTTETTLRLSERDWEQFRHHLDHPPEPNAKAREAAAKFQEEYGRVDD